MNGNECVMSPGMEKLKQNGTINIVASKQETVLISGELQVQSSGPDSASDRVNQVPENPGTPISSNDIKTQCKSKYYTCPTSAGPLKYLHRTPPSRNKNIVVTNPFDVGITERLQFPMYSPSVFARVVSPSQESPTFRWTIEDISRIYPADIEEFPTHQYDQAVDPEFESKAQEAINRFFHKTQPLLPSPWNPRPDTSTTALRQEVNQGTPTTPCTVAQASLAPVQSNQHIDSDSDHDQSASSSKASAREVWTQTTLTLPPVLPPSMELALKPFFTFTQDQQQCQQPTESEEGVLSTSTLRRKLFYSDSSPSPSTPVSAQGANTQPRVQFQARSFGTPLPGGNTLQSPPDISPVHSDATPMRRVKSATRLDFSREHEDMTLDTSLPNAPSTPRPHLLGQVGACSPLGTAPLHNKDNAEDLDEDTVPGNKWVKRNKRNSLDCSSDSMKISQTSTPVKSIISMEVSNSQNMMDISQSKPSSQTGVWREGEVLSDVTYQHEVNSFSYSHQAASSNMLSQDTGYGTRSSCDPNTFQSGTSMFGLSLTRDKMGYEDSLATWPINPNVISSTPTKAVGTRISEYQRDTA